MSTIKGLEQFEAQLKKLSLVVQREKLLGAVMEGAEVIREAFEEAAPRLSGELAENMVISKVLSETTAAQAVVKIGAASKVFYGYFDEYGTAHQQAEPFAIPAFERVQAEAEEKVAKALKESIEGA